MIKRVDFIKILVILDLSTTQQRIKIMQNTSEMTTIKNFQLFPSSEGVSFYKSNYKTPTSLTVQEEKDLKEFKL